MIRKTKEPYVWLKTRSQIDQKHVCKMGQGNQGLGGECNCQPGGGWPGGGKPWNGGPSGSDWTAGFKEWDWEPDENDQTEKDV